MHGWWCTGGCCEHLPCWQEPRAGRQLPHTARLFLTYSTDIVVVCVRGAMWSIVSVSFKSSLCHAIHVNYLFMLVSSQVWVITTMLFRFMHILYSPCVWLYIYECSANFLPHFTCPTMIIDGYLVEHHKSDEITCILAKCELNSPGWDEIAQMSIPVPDNIHGQLNKYIRETLNKKLSLLTFRMSIRMRFPWKRSGRCEQVLSLTLAFIMLIWSWHDWWLLTVTIWPLTCFILLLSKIQPLCLNLWLLFTQTHLIFSPSYRNLWGVQKKKSHVIVQKIHNWVTYFPYIPWPPIFFFLTQSCYCSNYQLYNQPPKTAQLLWSPVLKKFFKVHQQHTRRTSCPFVLCS